MSHSLRYLLAFIGPLAGTLLLTPVAERLALSAGIVDRPRADRFHSRATPYLGGLAIAGTVAGAELATGTSGQILTILLGGLVMAALGLLDDFRSVGPLAKIGVEAACGLALWITGVRAGFFGIESLDLVLTIVWVVAAINAVNMLDNMDGVTSAVVGVSAFGFFVIAADRGDYLVASLALGLAGGSIGFLKYNFPPARIFLGDSGTLMMGFLLAALGLKLDLMGPSTIARAIIPALLLGVPLFDMTLVVVARLRARRPVYVGGTDHTAHRLASRGLSIRTVALAALSTQVVCSALAFWLNRASTATAAVAAVGCAGVALLGWGLLLRLDHAIGEGFERTPIEGGIGQESPVEKSRA